MSKKENFEFKETDSIVEKLYKFTNQLESDYRENHCVSRTLIASKKTRDQFGINTMDQLAFILGSIEANYKKLKDLENAS